jgi:hypothetical protein
MKTQKNIATGMTEGQWAEHLYATRNDPNMRRCDDCMRECVFSGTRNDTPCPRHAIKRSRP